jgi:hypothetical protein
MGINVLEKVIDWSGPEDRNIYILKQILRVFHELMNLSPDSDLM